MHSDSSSFLSAEGIEGVGGFGGGPFVAVEAVVILCIDESEFVLCQWDKAVIGGVSRELAAAGF